MKELSIRQKLAKIQVELKATKSKRNKFGNYNYRSAEDILEALKPFIAKYDVVITIKEKLLPNDRIKSTATITDADTGMYEWATAIVGVDLQQKGMATAQQFGSASSYGKKYALGNLFLIDDTADADATNNHGMGNVSKKPELTGEALKKAIAFVKNGGDVKAIQTKYTISAANLKKLQ